MRIPINMKEAIKLKKIPYIMLIFLLINTVNAEDDKSFILRKKIMEAKKKIEEYNTKVKETDKRTKEFNESHIKRIGKRNSDIKRLNSDVIKLERELKNEKYQNSTLKRSLKNFEIQFSLYRDKIKNQMDLNKKSIKTGFPYNKEERTTNISRLITDAEFESIAPEEIFNRYYNFLNRELLIGLDSEVYVKEDIKYLRIGWIILAYSDDQGKEVGLLTMKNDKWEWKTNLDFTMRKTIRDSIKMVEGKKAPDLMDFPIPLSLVRESMKGGAK